MVFQSNCIHQDVPRLDEFLFAVERVSSSLRYYLGMLYSHILLCRMVTLFLSQMRFTIADREPATEQRQNNNAPYVLPMNVFDQ
jgi:hypothetical protein